MPALLLAVNASLLFTSVGSQYRRKTLEYLTLRDGSIGRGEVVGEQGRG